MGGYAVRPFIFRVCGFLKKAVDKATDSPKQGMADCLACARARSTVAPPLVMSRYG